MRKCDLESYVRNTHMQEEYILFGGKQQNKTTHTKFGDLSVWFGGRVSFLCQQAKKKKNTNTKPHHTKGSDAKIGF